MAMPLLLFCLQLLISILQCTATDPGDTATMHALARSLGADSALGWGNQSGDPCGGTWAGVVCTDDGRVLEIRCSKSGLTGTLPADIGKLTFLTTLDLSFNSLSGPLPSVPAATALTFLTELDVRSNHFSYVPANFFAGLPAIAYVYLDDNPFTAWPIPAQLSKCANLQVFSANNAGVTGSLPDFLGNGFPSLINVSLSGNALCGHVPKFGPGVAVDLSGNPGIGKKC